jgi:hypothetical protein
LEKFKSMARAHASVIIFSDIGSFVYYGTVAQSCTALTFFQSQYVNK